MGSGYPPHQRLCILFAMAIRSRTTTSSLWLRSDIGPEFVSHAILKWIKDQGIELTLIDPGKPWQNGVSKSFNGKFRDECLSMEWFSSRDDAKVVIASWLEHFNSVRPHSSLGDLTPNVLAEKCRSESVASEQARGRDAAVLAADAPRPVAQPLRKGQRRTNCRAELSS